MGRESDIRRIQQRAALTRWQQGSGFLLVTLYVWNWHFARVAAPAPQARVGVFRYLIRSGAQNCRYRDDAQARDHWYFLSGGESLLAASVG